MLLNGIISVNKPQGFTSFDVIAKMRGILKMKKLGHSGTLDPMATGVLPVFVGNATKAISLMPESFKIYKAGFKLGITTDTQDITGKILSETKAEVTLSQLKETSKKFKGEISQIPPMYSAVSVNGKRLYELARQGIEVERKPRRAVIRCLAVLEYNEVTAEGIIHVSCSGGTYVRTLIHDIGQELGCGGVMTSLVRGSSNGFDIAECVTLEQLEELRDKNQLEGIVIPVERIFSDLPEIHLSDRKTQMYRNGVKLHLDKLDCLSGSDVYRIYTPRHKFLGLGAADTKNNELRVLKNLVADDENTCNGHRRTAVALGIFDGIHKGHRLILDKALSYPELTPAVFTFITESIKKKHGKSFEYIYPNIQKLESIRSEFGFRYIESFNFESLKNLSGDEFVKSVLLEKMNAGAVICGENFRFGRNAECSAGDLMAFGERYGFDVKVISLEKKSEIPVSSELIREYLRQGKVKELRNDFDFVYSIEGTVSEGNKIGRTLDFPTINQQLGEGQLIPLYGVYASRTTTDNGRCYKSVTNMGVKPTVGGVSVPLAETYIIGFSGNLYGKNVYVELVDFIREERKFSSLDELKKQINADIERIDEICQKE